MLNSKKRLAILIIGGLILIIPTVLNQMFILVNSPLNPTNINLYQTDTKIKYECRTNVGKPSQQKYGHTNKIIAFY